MESSILTTTTGNQSEGFSLYIHVPFCKRKCGYCHFYVLKPNASNISLFLNNLKKEMKLHLPSFQGQTLKSLYLGGGTPSLLDEASLKQLFSDLKQYVNFAPETTEITLEMNPETGKSWDFTKLVNLGVNRLSLGVQSFDSNLLTLLERDHTTSDVEIVCNKALKAGLTNISCDLMYEVPNQSLELWKDTLQTLTKFPFTHLSLYNLTIEPNTSFYKRREELTKSICSLQEQREMYCYAKEFLENEGWWQYEISAFAKQGLFSQHNTGYWHGRNFIGLGPSAFSYLHPKRFQNTPNLLKWGKFLKEEKTPVSFEEILPQKEKRRELLAIALRLLEGVRLDYFEEKWGKLSSQDHQNIHLLKRQGLLKSPTTNKLSLTYEGILHYDTVASELI